MRREWVAVALAVLAMPALGQSADGISSLETNLNGLRAACADQAQKAKSEFGTATYKQTLEMETDRTQAEMDAKVYAVGHGRRETQDFYLSRLKENSDSQAARLKAISDKFSADRQAVQTCVAGAKDQGKAAYVEFKASPKHKRYLAEAESLMTAWLVNVDEISTEQPQGTESSKTNWSTAKAHAELQ